MAGEIIIIGLFFVLGIVLINGKGSSLIAGYNTLPKEEKEKYDTVALCKFIGKMMFSLSFSMVFWLFEIKWLFTVGIVLVISVVLFMVIYVNTGERFKK